VSLSAIDRGDGHPVLLLHGQPGSAASWNSLVPYLEPRFRVLAPDRPGYGATGGEPLGLRANAEVLVRFLGEREVRPPTIVAHSWSGGVAVLLAADRPDLVSSLVLVGAACTPDSVDAVDRLLGLPVVGEAVSAVGLMAMGGVRERLVSLLPDESVLGAGSGPLRESLRSFVVEQRALLNELPEVTRVLDRIRVPTTVVAGEWDLVVRPRAAATLAAAVPGADLVLLPRVGHFVARDAPGALAAAITSSVHGSEPCAESC
jgi:pimeloyl-ACP methyl ester carboxylesterase